MLCRYSYESRASGNRLMEPFIVSLVQTEMREFSTQTAHEAPTFWKVK